MKLCWGTMRMLDHAKCLDEWLVFFERLYKEGITTLHVSNEYPSYLLLLEILSTLYKEKGVAFSFIVKVPEPAFNEEEFSAERFINSIDKYKEELPGEISIVQWMWRSNVEDSLRVDQFKRNLEQINKAIEGLNVFCFPYSQGFVQAALDEGDFKGFCFYSNQQESEFDYLLAELNGLGKKAVIIRPFLFSENVQAKSIFAEFKKRDCVEYIIFTATKESHLVPIFEYVNGQF